MKAAYIEVEKQTDLENQALKDAEKQTSDMAPMKATAVPEIREDFAAGFCSAFTCFTIIGVMLFFSGALSSASIGQPKMGDGKFKSPNIDLASLSVSNFNISDNQISGKWEIGLNIRNPNGAVVFRDIWYSVAWSGAPDQALVAGSEANPVVQPANSQTALNLKGSTEWLTLSNIMTGDFMRRDLVNHGFLAFNVRFSGSIESYDESHDKLWSWDQIRVPLNNTPNSLIGEFHGNIPGQ